MRSTIVWTLTLSLLSAAACTRGGPLVALDDAVVLDRRTNLEWTRHDHAESLPWDEADAHCRRLAIGDRHGWRLPEIGELQALYDPRVTEPCGERACHLDPAIRLGGPYVWSATAREQGTRFYFDVSAGNSFSPSLSPRLVRRVLCVRPSGS